MRKTPTLTARIRRFARRLRRDQNGVSVVEFALCLPLIVTLGFYGVEVAWMKVVNMQTSELALTVADNASRLGQTDNTALKPSIAESDVDAIMFGASQQGKNLDIANKGRIILSSLEVDPITGKQFIHWQRCYGGFAQNSAYGDDNLNNGLKVYPLYGMGRPSNLIKANPEQAVMFAEVYINYTPLFGNMFVKNMVFKQESAFIVRDNRDLDSGNLRLDLKRVGLTGTAKSTC